MDHSQPSPYHGHGHPALSPEEAYQNGLRAAVYALFNAKYPIPPQPLVCDGNTGPFLTVEAYANTALWILKHELQRPQSQKDELEEMLRVAGVRN